MPIRARKGLRNCETARMKFLIGLGLACACQGVLAITDQRRPARRKRNKLGAPAGVEPATVELVGNPRAFGPTDRTTHRRGFLDALPLSYDAPVGSALPREVPCALPGIASRDLCSDDKSFSSRLVSRC